MEIWLTPGIEAARFKTLRFVESGSSAMRLASKLTPISALVVLISGASVITRTVSVVPATLRNQIEKRFDVKTSVVDNTVRIERPRGHEFIPTLVEAFPGEIDSVSVGKPTLDAVFVHFTGRRLEES